VCGDYPAAKELAKSACCPRVSYGESSESDWKATDVEFCDGRTFFEPCYHGKSDGRLEVGVIGRHNVMNALAVYAMGRTLGLTRETLNSAFQGFEGVKRRQEKRGERRGVLVIDDFAHHPTAVRETIEAVKSAYRGRRVWAVFEPRSNTSKRNIFEKEFAEALGLADRVVIANVYQPEKISESERLSVENVAGLINARGAVPKARVSGGAAEIASQLAGEAESGDVVLVMSNGGFDSVHEKILQALAR
jgi:UDP-N-acetylmuramate: L-alanyl-gamma-D-glutamyl-meso-diaminopimelate ligase